MSARFAGVIAQDVAPRPPRLPENWEHTSFDGGFVGRQPGMAVASEDGSLCLALGDPRFCDAEAAWVAGSRGVAAAWIGLFRRHGAEALPRVAGRYSVIVLNPDEREAWLACDRFGTWPLCYSVAGGRLAFSDRADAVPVDTQVSRQALFDYLYFHMIPGPRTIFADVERLPAGHALRWRRGEIMRHAYWTPRFEEPAAPDLVAAKAEFRRLVREAVIREANGRARVGAFLSGGTDSSTVSGMLGQVTGEPARTYSMGFDASGYDEMEYARIAARHFRTEHHEYYVTPQDLVDAIPRVAAHYDQPFGNSSAVPAWICARMAREDGIEKMLAGDGGDELFGGNVRYARQQLLGWYSRLPGPVRRQVVEPLVGLPGVRRVPLLKKGASYVEQARVPMPDRAEAYNLLLRLGPASIFTRHFLHSVDATAPLREQRRTWESSGECALINRMLAYDWKYTLVDNDLPKVIGTTQLAGVDVGFPLLSDELIDFSLRLPARWKLKGLTLRWFFKEALRDFLPEAIITKKKHGFGLPFGLWALNHPELGRLASTSLAQFGERGIIRREFLEELIQRWLPEHPGYYGEMVWIVMIAEQWLQAHAPDLVIRD